ncbi:hypothetical protein [Kineococcus sp. NUM-3379]
MIATVGTRTTPLVPVRITAWIGYRKVVISGAIPGDSTVTPQDAQAVVAIREGVPTADVCIERVDLDSPAPLAAEVGK